MSSAAPLLQPLPDIRPAVKLQAVRPWFQPHTVALDDGHKVGIMVAGIGRPVVMINGYTACCEVDLQTASRLVQQGFMVILVDVAGHGRTDPLKGREAFNLLAYARLLVRVIDHLGINHALFIGHSLGGFIITALGAMRPDLVDGLIPADGIGSPAWDDHLNQLIVHPQRLPAFGLNFLRDGFHTVPFTDIRSGQLQKFVRQMAAAYWRQLQHLQRLAAPGLAIALGRFSQGSIDRIAAAGLPVATLHGDDDRIVPHHCSLAVAEATGGIHVTIHGGGHSWLLKCPDTLAAIVAELMDGPFGFRTSGRMDYYQPKAPIRKLATAPDRRRRRRASQPQYRWSVRSFA